MARKAARRPPQRTSGKTAALLVVLSTFLIAAGQLLLKLGIAGTPIYLLIGIVLLGIAGVLVAFAFKHGDLSALHALFGLGFLWVTLVGIFMLGETLSGTQLAGIAIIIAGVAMIGGRP